MNKYNIPNFKEYQTDTNSAIGFMKLFSTQPIFLQYFIPTQISIEIVRNPFLNLIAFPYPHLKSQPQKANSQIEESSNKEEIQAKARAKYHW